MSKMGEELERRLDENKDELWDCLKELVIVIDDEDYTPDSFTTQPARRILAKIEGKK